MKTLIFIFLCFAGLAYSNSITLIEDGAKVIKGEKSLSTLEEVNLIAKAGKLEKVTQEYLTASKIENIQELINLAVKENRINFLDQFQYIKLFKSMKDGDRLLLKCLKNPKCNLKNYSLIVKKSPLHAVIAAENPTMNLAQVNSKIDTIIDKLYNLEDWTKVSEKIGKNGIKGIYTKEQNGKITKVMFIEGKYNKNTLNSSISKDELFKKVRALENQNPNNKNYKEIEKIIKYGDKLLDKHWKKMLVSGFVLFNSKSIIASTTDVAEHTVNKVTDTVKDTATGLFNSTLGMLIGLITLPLFVYLKYGKNLTIEILKFREKKKNDK